MLTAYREKMGIKIADVYFFEDEDLALDNPTDIVFYLQRSDKTKNSTDFHTLLFDLLKDEKALFSEINRTTKYHINRAVKNDNIKCLYYMPTREDILEFADFYNVLAGSKKLPECNLDKLDALSAKNGLVFTKALDESGNALSCHAYIVDKKRARLLYAASHFRQTDDNNYKALIGRANKYLHWSDIVNFKKEGYLTYDFGGIAISDQEKPEIQNIARFKKAFGGEETHEYNLIEGRSLLGKVLVKIYILLQKLKHLT